MSKPLRILILILTLMISILSLYFQYDVLFKFNQIGYINKSIKLVIAIITCVNLLTIIPSLLFHFRFILHAKDIKNIELLDDEFKSNKPTISSFLKIGHILMGMSIAFLGFYILYFFPNLIDKNPFNTNVVYFVILIGFVIITDGLTSSNKGKKKED